MSIVTDYLADKELEFTAYDHRRAYTSIEEARALGIHADEVIKTVVLDTRGGHALAVIPATDRLDMHRVREVTGDPEARLADEDEIRKDLPAFHLGAIPPLGALLDMPVFVDPAVAEHDHVVFASGRQTESVRLHTADLLADKRVRVVELRSRAAPKISA